MPVRWDVAPFRERVFGCVAPHLAGRARVLDLGCGDGGNSEYLAARGHAVVALDVELADLVTSGARGAARYVVGRGEALPFRTGAFDAVVVKDVLPHAGDPGAVLAEARRAARMAGTVVVLEPNRFNPLFYAHMTLLEGHDHLTCGQFVDVIRRHLPGAALSGFEAHVYPAMPRVLLGLVRAAERLFERLPGARYFRAYNVAVSGG